MAPDRLGVGVERSSPIPRRYMLPTETDLTFTVAEEENVIDIDVPAK